MHTDFLRCFFSCIFPETTWWRSEGLSEQLALHVGPTFGEPALVPLPQGNDSAALREYDHLEHTPLHTSGTWNPPFLPK